MDYNFHAENITSIDDLNHDDIVTLLEIGNYYAEQSLTPRCIQKRLKNYLVFNIFLENSTRTRLSFETAAHRLGANVINMSAEGSSIKKGESFKDTLLTLNAMRPDLLVLRHNELGAAKDAVKYMDCPVINAGDGTQEHPTQALLDALTIYRTMGQLKGITVAICGDIKHSRVAGSNTKLLKKMGANVRLVAPMELLPDETDCETFTDMKSGLQGADIIMMLRIQKERLNASLTLNEKDYFDSYGLTKDTLLYAKPNAFIMHPGPMNRGIEISSDMADHLGRSLIVQQVEMGVAMRMACLHVLAENLEKQEENPLKSAIL